MVNRKEWTAKARARQSIVSPDAREFIDQMKGQMLIVLVNRLGGSIDLPVEEVDGTGAFNLMLSLNNGQIHLETRRKN